MMKLKNNKTFTKSPRKKSEIKRIKTKLENIIFDKLGWKYKIVNKKTSTNGTRTKIKKSKE